MNWLLVHAPATPVPGFPIGLAYVSAALREAGVDVACIDLQYVPHHSQDSVLRLEFTRKRPDVVAISSLSQGFGRTRDLVQTVRGLDARIPIVLGGGLVSSTPELVFGAIDADIGVLGEGERTVIELAAALAADDGLGHVDGLLLRVRDGCVRRTAPRAEIKDIDELPIPDYNTCHLDQFLDSQRRSQIAVYTCRDKPRMAPIILSRACPYRCTFCYHPLLEYRARSMSSVFREIALLRDNFGINGLLVYDDLFAADRGRLETFCRLIRDYGLAWTCQMRVSLLNRELLELLRDAGCYTMTYGYESMSNEVLRSMRKGIRPAQISNTAQLTYAERIHQGAYFIFGDPAERLETIDETLNWWLGNRHYGVLLRPLIAYPGTQIYHNACAKGIIPDQLGFLEQGCPPVNLASMSEESFRDVLAGVALLERQFLFPGRIHELWEESTGDEAERFYVAVDCPHCGTQKVVYGPLVFGDAKPICKHCGGRFDVPVSLYCGRSGRNPRATAMLERAWKEYTEGDPVAAEVAARRCLALDNSDYEAWSLLASSTIQQGRFAEAEAPLYRALILCPASADAHNNVGVWNAAVGKLAWALIHFRQAMLLNPHSQQAPFNADRVGAEIGVNWGPLRLFSRPYMTPVKLDALRLAPPLTMSQGSLAWVWPPLRTESEHPLRVFTSTPDRYARSVSRLSDVAGFREFSFG